MGPNVWTTKREKLRCIQTDAAGIAGWLWCCLLVLGLWDATRVSDKAPYRLLGQETDRPPFCPAFPPVAEDVQAYPSSARPGSRRQEGRDSSRHPGRTCRLS